MRKLLYYSLIASISLLSCGDDNDQRINQKVTFKLNSSELDTNEGSGRILNQTIPHRILVSIENSERVEVITDETILLTQFGDGYISSSIELQEGNYFLTSFLVINEDDQVIYVSPIAGSEKAYLVSIPLPLEFSVTAESETIVSPEVIQVLEGTDPVEYGYAVFGFSIIETFSFNTAVIAFSDSSYRASDISIKGYDSNDELMLEHTLSTNNSDATQVQLSSKLKYYTFEINHEGYHSLSHIYQTIDLIELTDLPFVISSIELTAAIKVSDLFKGNNTNPQEIFIYFPLDGCLKSFRVDFGGFPLNDVDYIQSVRNEDLSINDIDQFYDDNPSGGYFQWGSTNTSENLCDGYPDEENLTVEKYFSSNYLQNELILSTVWDEATGQWTATDQVIYKNISDLIFHETYDLNN